jgi:hypothetical protein
LSAVRSAFDNAFNAVQNVANLRDAVLADPVLTAGAKELKIRTAALAAGDRAAKVLDKAREATATELRRLRAESLPPPPKDPAIAAEVRSALRGMPEKQRAATIDAAIASGDHGTVGAVLAGADFLSGLGAGQRNLAEFGWRSRYRATELERLERLENVEQAIEIGAGALVSFVKEASSSPIAQQAEQAQARTAEAQAALNPAAQPAPAE